MLEAHGYNGCVSNIPLPKERHCLRLRKRAAFLFRTNAYRL